MSTWVDLDTARGFSGIPDLTQEELDVAEHQINRMAALVGNCDREQNNGLKIDTTRLGATRTESLQRAVSYQARDRRRLGPEFSEQWQPSATSAGGVSYQGKPPRIAVEAWEELRDAQLVTFLRRARRVRDDDEDRGWHDYRDAGTLI